MPFLSYLTAKVVQKPCFDATIWSTAFRNKKAPAMRFCSAFASVIFSLNSNETQITKKNDVQKMLILTIKRIFILVYIFKEQNFGIYYTKKPGRPR